MSSDPAVAVAKASNAFSMHSSQVHPHPTKLCIVLPIHVTKLCIKLPILFLLDHVACSYECARRCSGQPM